MASHFAHQPNGVQTFDLGLLPTVYNEKKEATEQVDPVPQHDHSDDEPQSAETSEPLWQPGFVSRFPWLGIGALFFVLLCLGGNIVILAVSDGMPQGDQTWSEIRKQGLTKNAWPKQIRPSVCLTILNNLANLAFSLAIANGVAIAWWRKALKGSTIDQLHKSWNFSSSVKAAALAGRSFNFIALAALVAKFTVIDGVLMQSATITELVTDVLNNTTIRTWARDSFPVTGSTVQSTDTSTSHITYQIADFFADELYVWDQNPRSLPLIGFEGCVNATCFARVPAAGLKFNCSKVTETTIDLYKDLMPEIEEDGSVLDSSLKSTTVYDVSFHETNGDGSITEAGYVSDSLSKVLMNVSYTKSRNEGGSSPSACPGTLYKQTCTLTPAVVTYPIMVQNYGGPRGSQSVTFATPQSKDSGKPLPFDYENQQQEGFQVERTLEFAETYLDDVKLRGVMQAFTQYLTGHASIKWHPTRGFSLIQRTGNVQTYILDGVNTSYGQADCGVVFNNPMAPDSTRRNTQSLVAMMNEIMFALSMDISNTDPDFNHDFKDVSATIYAESIHFKTRYLYMMGAIISTVICVACVLPTYWGYWQLGRKVSLGPFEIAHAFRSPMTAPAQNGTIDQVIDCVGHRQVQYGHIVSGDARGVFGIAEPEYVARMDGSRKSRR